MSMIMILMSMIMILFWLLPVWGLVKDNCKLCWKYRHLQNDESIAETVVEVVHIRVEPKVVDPVAECLNIDHHHQHLSSLLSSSSSNQKNADFFLSCLRCDCQWLLWLWLNLRLNQSRKPDNSKYGKYRKYGKYGKYGKYFSGSTNPGNMTIVIANMGDWVK